MSSYVTLVPLMTKDLYCVALESSSNTTSLSRSLINMLYPPSWSILACFLDFHNKLIVPVVIKSALVSVNGIGNILYLVLTIECIPSFLNAFCSCFVIILNRIFFWKFSSIISCFAFYHLSFRNWPYLVLSFQYLQWFFSFNFLTVIFGKIATM